jgi:hypothetical protein
MTQSRWMTRLGWTISGLVLVFLFADATMKLLALTPVLEAGEQIGFPGAGINRVLGLILLFSALLAALPRTALIGSVLVTAYLGGAVATQMRVDAPLGSHVFFGVYLGIALWLGLFMRRPNIRALFRVSR